MSMTVAKLRTSAVVGAVLLVGLMSLNASRAAFSGSTENAPNEWAAGSVVLVDDDAGVPLFDDLTNLVPGDTETDCIEVSYTGTVDAQVRIHGITTAGTGLDGYLDLTIERGTGTCAAFVPSVTVWDGTNGDLGVFLSTATDYSTGADTWSVTGGLPNEMVPFRVTATVQDDNGAQGLDTTVTFTWEGQNT